MVVEGPDWMALSVAPSAAAALPAPPLAAGAGGANGAG